MGRIIEWALKASRYMGNTNTVVSGSIWIVELV